MSSEGVKLFKLSIEDSLMIFETELVFCYLAELIYAFGIYAEV